MRLSPGTPGAFTFAPELTQTCWGCGRTGITGVGQIVYEGNEATQKRTDKQLFAWQDPAAFYAAATPHKTVKSGMDRKANRPAAANGRDLKWLCSEERAQSLVGKENPDHQGWCLVIPCTNPAENKTFDHRKLEFASLAPEAVCALLPAEAPARQPKGLDGWTEPRRAAGAGGAACFVQTAARLLTHADWAALSAAGYGEMHDSPAAFDIFSGLLWSLRRSKVSGLPSRNVAWLVLKLMATVPPRARFPDADTGFCPLRSLPKRQLAERRQERPVVSPYPVSFPRGHRLEAELRQALDRELRGQQPKRIDWAGLCHGLDQLLD